MYVFIHTLNKGSHFLAINRIYTTVRLGKMAQYARLWALFMSKLKGQLQNANNMALGECIGLQHIQISAY